MPILPFGQFQPDVSDLNRQYTQSILNVVPQADGYGPLYELVPYSDALPGPCRGAFYARKQDGGVAIFAGTDERLYLLDNTALTWTDVSRDGMAYTPMDAAANWSFVQFNDFVIVTQDNDEIQAFTLSSDSEFDDLSVDAPRAAYLAIINRYLVAGGIDGNANAVQWTALNDVTNWTTLDSDLQILPDGGGVKGIVGGDLGIIIQSGAIRRMVFQPGSAEVFQISRIVKDLGSDFPWSILEASGMVFFLSQKGFMRLSVDGALQPIGEQRVNKTFFNTFDPSAPQLVLGSANPDTNVVFWGYKTADSGSPDDFDSVLLYDYVQDRWAPAQFNGKFLASVSRSGLTLEGLGVLNGIEITGAANNGSGLIRLTVATTTGWTTGLWKDVAAVTGTTEANGTWLITVIDGTHIDLQGSTFSNAYVSGGYVAGSVDDLDLSSLDDVSSAALPKFSAFDANNRLAFFSGDPVEATLETAEQTGLSSRVFCSGLTPMTDAEDVRGSLGTRENLRTAPAYTAEQSLNDQGFIPARRSTRHIRAKLRIPAGTQWTYCTGVEPIYEPDGER